MSTGSAAGVLPALRQAGAAPDRRERRKAETRRRLLAAARTLFVERGYDATRPQDIARAADLGTGTFYTHFADKREAFQAFTDQAAAELMDLLRERTHAASGFAARLARSLEALCEYADAHPGVLRAAFADEAVLNGERPRDQSLRTRLAASLAQALREGMTRGEIHGDYEPLLVAHGIVGLVQQALGFGSREQIERREMLENLTRFCSRALVRPPEPRTRETRS